MNVVKRALSVFGRLGILMAIMVAFIFGLASTVYLSLRSPEVTVPDVVGKDRLTAESTLSDLGLNLRVRATRYSTEAKPETVLLQFPRGGEVVKAGQTIAVDISRATAKEGETSTPLGGENKNEAEAKTDNENDNKDDASKNKNTNENLNREKSNKNTRNKNTNNSNNSNNSNNTNNANANRNANDRNANNRNANANVTGNNRNTGGNNRNANANRPANNSNANRRPPIITTPPFNPSSNTRPR